MDPILTRPEGQAAKRLEAIPGVRFTQGAVLAFDGPNATGPEEAGGVVVLQGMSSDEQKAQVFWERFAVLAERAQASPGFIRLMAFADGLSNYAVGFWRTPEEAISFAQSRAHREAVAEQTRDRNLSSQFAGVWSAHTVSPRRYYCECGTATAAPAATCAGCGEAIADAFRMQALQT